MKVVINPMRLCIESLHKGIGVSKRYSLVGHALRAHGVSDDDIDILNRTGSWDVTGKWDKFWGLVPEKCRILARHQYALYQRLESYAIGVGGEEHGIYSAAGRDEVREIFAMMDLDIEWTDQLIPLEELI